ncbi:hypothetical protein PC121_g11502 [Phytophthora cactorum]|nr:hypothetical protein PC121_g11502 [Phytophthora cactorum]
MENALLRSIREGQDSGTYLVLDADVADAWPELCISPFGCVPKADADSRFAARLIHDLSFPRGSFVNDASDPDDLPPLTYEHVGELALRIESTKSNKPRVRVKLKRGDVKIAFRHIHGHPRAGAQSRYWRGRIAMEIESISCTFAGYQFLRHYGRFIPAPARLTAPLPRGRLTSAVSHHVATVVHVLLSASRLDCQKDRLRQAPFDPSLATSAGIIASTPAATLSSRPLTASCWPACSESPCSPKPANRSHSKCSNRSWRASIPEKPTTASLVKGTRRAYTLQVGDVKIRDVHEKITSSWDRASTVENCFRGSKNDQGGNSATRKLKRSDHATLCPARAALALLHHASTIGSSNKSPLCLVASGELLSADSMATALRRAAASLGANSTRISCHSLRSGAATALLSAGVDSTLVMLRERWRSDVFQRYTRYDRQSSANLAMRMARGSPERVTGRGPADANEGFTPHGVLQRIPHCHGQ